MFIYIELITKMSLLLLVLVLGRLCIFLENVLQIYKISGSKDIYRILFLMAFISLNIEYIFCMFYYTGINQQQRLCVCVCVCVCACVCVCVCVLFVDDMIGHHVLTLTFWFHFTWYLFFQS